MGFCQYLSEFSIFFMKTGLRAENVMTKDFANKMIAVFDEVF